MADESHVFSSNEELLAFVTNLEIETCCRFTITKARNHRLEDLESLEKHKIRWEVTGIDTVKPTIQYNGLPFVVLGVTEWRCHQGPPRNPSSEVIEHEDHAYGSKKKRRMVRPSKKQSCTAMIRARSVLVFPDFKVTGEPSKYKKDCKVKELRKSFSSSTQRETKIYAHVDNMHCGHIEGELGALSQVLDKRVTKKIHDLANEGIQDTNTIRKLVDVFVKKELGISTTSLNRRFVPTGQDIRNHVYRELSKNRFSSNDQENALHLVKSWEDQNKDSSFFFRPASVSADGKISDLLFIHQTPFQKKMLLQYGQEIVVMDATYQTSVFDIPLFFLGVRSNIGYIVVASFCIGKETSKNIAEALRLLGSWNPAWCPRYFMTDNDIREITAIESTFAGSFVYLCDFHREQAWERWFKARKHDAFQHMEQTMTQLRKIAHAESEEQLKLEMDNLRAGQLYTENQTFQRWIDNQWLNESKRWVYCYRQNLCNIAVNTTNGLESQHRQFKDRFLKEFGTGKSLSSMLTVLVTKFVPSAEDRYVTGNLEGLAECKNYNPALPVFLTDRPKPFLMHCVNRLPPSVTQIAIEDIAETVPALEFRVTSPDSGTLYTVSISDGNPRCTCRDWKMTHWPCKHLLAVLTCAESVSWDSLSHNYINNPLYVLDNKIISCAKDKEDSVVYHEETHSDHPAPSITPVSSGLPSEKTLRNSSLEVLKNIQSNLFMVSDEQILDTANKMLSDVESFLSHNVPLHDNLPVRRTGKQKRQNTGNLQHSDRVVENIVGCDLSADLEGSLTINPVTDNFEAAVRAIWSKQQPSGERLGVIGQYTIYDSSIHFLKSNLSDEVMDAVLHLLSQQHNGEVYHISSVVFTSIMTDMSNSHGLLRSVDLYKYKTVIGAVNEGGSHWTLIMLQPKTKDFFYLNPLGEKEISVQTMLQNWYAFLRCRQVAGIDVCPIGSWKLVTPEHSIQIDGTSCGVYVLKFAEYFLGNRKLVIHVSDLQKHRMELSVLLLSHLETIKEDICTTSRPDDCVIAEDVNVPPKSGADSRKLLPTRNAKKKQRSSYIYQPLVKKRRQMHKYCICKKADDGKLYWMCDVCLEWFHPQCLGFDVDKEPDSFVCFGCDKKGKTKEDVKTTAD